MGKVKLFPSPEYTSKQPKDPVVPKLPMTGILLGPSKSGKTVALISMILEQYRGCFERIYLFSPSINVDDVHRGDHEGAGGPGADLLRGVGRAGTAPDYSPAAKDHGDQQADEAAIPLPDFDRYRRFRRQSAPAQAIGRQRAGHTVCARETLPDQHSREHPKTAPRQQPVRVNSQFFCIWRLRNQLEKDSLLEELTALVPKARLEAMYEAAVAEPYSFLSTC